MFLADQDSPRSVQPRRARLRSISPAGVPATLIILFCAGLIFGAPVSRAQEEQEASQQNQSVADAARRERARKQEQQKSAKHVYTEEDLKRSHILTPEDQAKVEARRNECAAKNNCAPAPAQNSPASLDANGKAAQPSLGELARQLRQQKELEALKPKQSQPFHLPMDNPALASPVVPEHAGVRPPVPPVLRPERHTPKNEANVFRRDPFAPAPPRPRVSFSGAAQLRPTIPPATHSSSPIAPKISLRPGSRSIFVAPAQPSRPGPDSSAAKPDHKPFEILPVHPSVAVRGGRRPSPVVPSKIFPALGPVAPLSVAPAKPAAPANPVGSAPAEGIRPRQVAPASSATSVRIQAGDSLWKLARRNLGRGTLWTQILNANPSVGNPNYLHVGDTLVLPAPVAKPAGSAGLSNAAKSRGSVAATIEIRKGDTLWSLAKVHLGQASNWSCLAAANPSIRDADHIYAGQRLVLPPSCGSAKPSGTSPNVGN
jgi:LysM repeat protein